MMTITTELISAAFRGSLVDNKTYNSAPDAVNHCTSNGSDLFNKSI